MASRTGEQPSHLTEPLSGGRVRTAAVMFVACCAGWLIMELEILGARVLQPHFGSDIYVTWGSVIGVFLLSLSVGYMLGGWLSGGKADQQRLALSLAVAGLWICLIPVLSTPVCEFTWEAGLEEKSGSLVAALALFGVPTVLLGTVSPTAVRWLTREARESGLKAGVVLAVSTAASFAGCVVTAFFLVALSLRRTLQVSGLSVMVLGAAIALHSLLRRRAAQAAAGAPVSKETAE